MVAQTRGAVIRGVVITIGGMAGALCIVWFALSLVFQLSIVVVTTGSMTPTLPTGSAAVVEPVAASDLEVGDVVTVPRPRSALPVTHRIVSIDEVAGDPEARSLVLRGDANATDDRDPYLVSEARRVIVGVPYVGTVFATLRQPLFMGAATLAIAVFVGWALWPSQSGRRVGAAAASSAAASTVPATESAAASAAVSAATRPSGEIAHAVAGRRAESVSHAAIGSRGRGGHSHVPQHRGERDGSHV